MTKRQAIDSLRKKIQEVNADSNFSNKFLYNELISQAKWLIKRDIQAGRIYKNTYFFQTLRCQNVIETSLIDPCCPIKTNCKIYRTECKIPDIWIDNGGPILKTVASVDFSTTFSMISPKLWESKRQDPYQRKHKQMYAFYADGYIWFPEQNPHLINLVGFWADDVDQLNGCADNPECVRFLDTRFMIPDWLEAEMFAKAFQQLVPTKQIPEDMQIDKNTNRKN